MNAIAKVDAPLPVNIEIEQQVLGAVLLDNETLSSIAGYLKPKHFHEPVHQRVYEVMLELRQAGRVVTAITVIDYLPAEQEIGEGVNLRLYVAQLAGECAGIIHAEDYARQVLTLALRRDGMAFGDDTRLAFAHAPPAASPATLLAEAEARLFDLGRDAARLTAGATSLTAGESGDALIRRLDGHDLPVPPIKTGFADLDKIIGGLRRGDLSILAGRPGMMKTGCATSLSLNVARAGLPVLYFSLEMTSDALASRMLGDLAYTATAPVAHNQILDQRVPSDRIQTVRLAADTLRAMPIVIDPRRGQNIAEVCLRARRWAAWNRRKGREPGLIIVDHLGKVKPTGKTDNRSLELGEITGALADEAGESNVPVLALCQLNRAAETRDNRRPQLSDLRESGRIEEDARVVMGVYRESYYLGRKHESDAEREMKRMQDLDDCKNDLEVIVLKNNHGPEGVAKLWVHVPAGAIRDREARG